MSDRLKPSPMRPQPGQEIKSNPDNGYREYLVRGLRYFYEEQFEEAGSAEKLGYTIDTPVFVDLINASEKYSETVTIADIGDRKIEHAKVHLNQDFISHVKLDRRNYVATRRVLFTTVGSFGVLLFITVVFSYLKFDSATRGYYTGRLQFMAVAAILTVVAAGALLAKWVNGI